MTIAEHDFADASARNTIEVALAGDHGTLDFLVRIGDGAWLVLADDLDARPSAPK